MIVVNDVWHEIPITRSRRDGMKRSRSADGRADKTTVEWTLIRGLCSSGAASICERGSMKPIDRTIHTRFPDRYRCR